MRLKPKKSLGQNFLHDGNIRRKIIDACAFDPGDTVCEIGAGTGLMTSLLAAKVKQVFALELDAGLIPVLEQACRDFDNVTVINRDVLKFDFAVCGKTGKTKVLGNIPYYITTPIIEQLVGCRERISLAFLTVQKEFGERIAAQAGEDAYGAFSCFVQYYCRPQVLFTIKKNSFFPAPKVDSCFLLLEMRQEPQVRVRDEARLFKLIRAAFQQRRKTLRNSLSRVVSQQALEQFFASSKIDPRIRAEQLSLADFARLTDQEISLTKAIK